jgi:hypothetical protein
MTTTESFFHRNRRLGIPRGAKSGTANRIVRQIAIGLCSLVGISYCAAAPTGQTSDTGKSVEFDLPADQVALLGKGAPIYFIVGYFADDGPSKKPLFAYEVRGSEITSARQGSVRLPLRGWQAPADRQRAVVRVRTVTATGQSPWSAPSGVVETQILAHLEPPSGQNLVKEPTPGHKGSASRTVQNGAAGRTIQEELRTNTALTTALERRFPKVNLSEAGTGYQTVKSFIAALCAASNTGIPFEELKPLTVSGPRNALAQALRKLRPEINAQVEAKQAQHEANKIVKAARQSTQPNDGKRQKTRRRGQKAA